MVRGGRQICRVSDAAGLFVRRRFLLGFRVGLTGRFDSRGLRRWHFALRYVLLVSAVYGRHCRQTRLMRPCRQGAFLTGMVV